MTKLNESTKLDFDDVLLVPQRSKAASRKDVDVNREFKFYHSNRIWSGTPIMAANMDTTGTFAMADSLHEQGCVTCLHKHYDSDEISEFFSQSLTEESVNLVWYSMGIKEEDFQKLLDLIGVIGYFPNICIDVANGYTDDFVNACKRVRSLADGLSANPVIMAGNVCTPEMVQEIILHGGVDIVKVGIGPGSVCTTRLKTGVGYPQLSAILECSHAAHGLRNGKGRLGLICADGGCRQPADVAKAFAAGADFVMLGGMLAGTDECEGEWTTETKKVFKSPKLGWDEVVIKKSLQFYGMSSEKAQDKHGGGLKDYRSSEGRVTSVPYKGLVSDVISDILGGIRSACAYTGATCLKDFAKTAEFIRVNNTHFNKEL